MLHYLTLERAFYKIALRVIILVGDTRRITVTRHYSDMEWARIVAGVWATERLGQVRMFMTTKRTMWSSELGREYGSVLCPIRRPSRALVVWLLANLEDSR